MFLFDYRFISNVNKKGNLKLKRLSKKQCKKNVKKENKIYLFNNIKDLINLPRFIAILILVSSLMYFAHFYFYSSSNYYIELTKGLVFPKNPIASADPIFYK